VRRLKMKKKISIKKNLLQTFGFVLIFLLLCGSETCSLVGGLDEMILDELEMEGQIDIYNNTPFSVKVSIDGDDIHVVGLKIASGGVFSAAVWVENSYSITAKKCERRLDNIPAIEYNLVCSPSVKKENEEYVFVTITQWKN
jgi:hypothetical protein